MHMTAPQHQDAVHVAGDLLHAVAHQDNGGAALLRDRPGSGPEWPPDPAGSRPAVGSSRIRTLGSMAMHARRWPPGASVRRTAQRGTFPAGRSVRPTKRGGFPHPAVDLVLGPGPCCSGPKAMSLYTVSSNSWYSGYWNTRPTWKRTCRMFLRLGPDVLPVEAARVPWVGRQQSVEVLDQGGLAGAGVADDAQELAGA